MAATNPRLVVVTGFANSHETAVEVAEAWNGLASWSDIAPFSYSEAKADPQKLAEALDNDAVAVSTSGGLEAIAGSLILPSEVHAFSPSDGSRSGLWLATVGTARKARQTAEDAIIWDGQAEQRKFVLRAAKELAQHTALNFGNIGAIAASSSVVSGITMTRRSRDEKGRDLLFNIAQGKRDAYFELNPTQRRYAERHGVNVLDLFRPPFDTHDAAVLYPEETVRHYDFVGGFANSRVQLASNRVTDVV